MSEKIITFKYGNENIRGIIHEPEQTYISDKKIMVVFLHGWAGYRVGPHNLLVEIARNLSEKGFYCCRFDFRGRGFSDGNCELTTFQTMFVDLEVVLRGIKEKYKPNHITLLGICSGGKLAIHYARKGSQRINNIIELSSSLLFNTNNLKLKIKRIRYIIFSYFNKLFLKETWYKLFNNQINFSLIIRRIINIDSRRVLDKNLHNRHREKKSDTPTTIYTSHLKNSQDKNGERKIEKNKFVISTTGAVRVLPFSNFSGQILSVHGQNDPETELTLKQVKSLCKKNNIEHSFYIIPKANHNYYSIKWKKGIIEIIEKWMIKNSKELINDLITNKINSK